MSRNTSATPVHIEWAPGKVHAVNIATNKTASGDSLAELNPILDGHRQVLVGVSRGLVFLKTMRLPKATPDDLRGILGVQLGQLFPLPPDQLAFDFIQTADLTADGCLTVVAAMRAEDLKQLRADFQQAGLTPTRILPVALGAPGVVERAGASDALLIERSASALTLDVVQGRVVRFSRGAHRDSDPLCEAQRTLAAARAGSLPLVVAKGVGLSEEILAPFTALSQLHEAPAFGFELTEDRGREAKKRVAARTRLALLMVLSAILLVALVWTNRSDAMAKVKRSQGASTRELGRLRSIRDGETTKAQQLMGIQTVLKSAFEVAQPQSDIMSAVGDNLPPGAWLTGLSIERGKPLLIRGTAMTSGDVGKFVNALGVSERFRDVKLVFANSAKIAETPVVQFNITAVAVGNLPMPEAEKPRARGAVKAAAPADATQ